MHHQIDELTKELNYKDKEIILMRKEKTELRKKIQQLDNKLTRLRGDPLSNLAPNENVQQLKNKIKTLDSEKKRLKVNLGELKS